MNARRLRNQRNEQSYAAPIYGTSMRLVPSSWDQCGTPEATGDGVSCGREENLATPLAQPDGISGSKTERDMSHLIDSISLFHSLGPVQIGQGCAPRSTGEQFAATTEKARTQTETLNT